MARNASHSDREILARQDEIALPSRVLTVKAVPLREYAAICRSGAFGFENSCSMGLKSGLYAGS